MDTLDLVDRLEEQVEKSRQFLNKAFVNVDERGTEAAAATAIAMARAGAPRPHPTFRADHPFLFLIRDNRTGSILFLGRLMNPKG